MTNFDERLRTMAHREDTPVPVGFDGRLAEKMAALPGERRRLSRGGKIILIAACLCIVAVGTAFASGVVQNIWNYVDQSLPAYRDLPSDRLEALAQEGTRTGGLESGYYLKEIGNWTQCKEYLAFRDNPWLEGDAFQFERGQAHVVYSLAKADGSLISAGISAWGTLNGYPFQFSADMYYDDGWMRLGYASIGETEPTYSNFTMDWGGEAVLFLRKDSVSAEFEAGGMVYDLRLDGPRDEVEPLLREILNDFQAE